MRPAIDQHIIDYLGRLIERGHELIGNTRHDDVLMGKFVAGCRHLKSVLGDRVGVWDRALGPNDQPNPNDLKHAIGQLEALHEVMCSGLLFQIESLARADAFSDLLEQADYLFGKKNYCVAAAVLGRAVLEEHLRGMCKQFGLLDKLPHNAMIGDMNTALYKANHLDKNGMMNVQAMAAVGNTAAHECKAEDVDVRRMLENVRAFLDQNKIA